jgi:hypothetical protein
MPEHEIIRPTPETEPIDLRTAGKEILGDGSEEAIQ